MVVCLLQYRKTITAPFDNLKRGRRSTAVISGRDDRRTTPAPHEALAKDIPGSELVIIDDAAHFTPLEQLGIVTGVLLRWMAL